jgi:hypothetical protein
MGRQGPVTDRIRAGEEADRDLGIAHIEGEEHGWGK